MFRAPRSFPSLRLAAALRLRALRLSLAISLTVVVPAAMAGAAAASQPRPAATPPPVDHQLCYTASATGFKIPAGVVLKNQFSPNGFAPTIGKLAFHCNPVQKTVPTGQVFPITNPNAHLACFTITEPTQPTPTVKVTNQFGSATLVPSQPNLLCLPSWKSLTGPPGRTPNQPPGLNHFTCYPVKVQSGAYTPPPVTLQDEFAPSPVSAQVNPVPAELCLPTEKIVAGVDNPIINAATHLLCFPVSQTPIRPQVWDQNQFGTSVVQISRTSWLCVPSTKQIVTG
jgi:hypothetical protein